MDTLPRAAARSAGWRAISLPGAGCARAAVLRSGDRLAATLGRHEHADADFAFACEFHHRHGLRLWEARAELGWAEALAERGELDRAQEHASRALELSRHHGYGAFEPRAAAIVASHAAVDP